VSEAVTIPVVIVLLHRLSAFLIIILFHLVVIMAASFNDNDNSFVDIDDFDLDNDPQYFADPE